MKDLFFINQLLVSPELGKLGGGIVSRVCESKFWTQARPFWKKVSAETQCERDDDCVVFLRDILTMVSRKHLFHTLGNPRHDKSTNSKVVFSSEENFAPRRFS